MSKHHEGRMLSDIGLSCSVRGGEGAFEEVKGGDKQVSTAHFVLKWMQEKLFTIIRVRSKSLKLLPPQASVRSTESKALTLGNKFDVLGAE